MTNEYTTFRCEFVFSECCGRNVWHHYDKLVGTWDELLETTPASMIEI